MPSSSTRPTWAWSRSWPGTIADPQVRNRGTIGGSLAHGDPASDLPAVMLICEASVTLQGAGGQQRSVAAADLFQDYLETAVEPTEVLTEIRMPAYDGWGYGYEKFNRRSEDWAMVAVSALVTQERRHDRGRAGRPDQHGLGAAAGEGRRGCTAGPAGDRGLDRARGRAGGRGHRSARRPQRQRPTTSAIWRGCCAGARSRRRLGREGRWGHVPYENRADHAPARASIRDRPAMMAV